MGLHGCDFPACCNVENPLHVHEGDNSLNMQEMFARGRQADSRRSGEKHFRARFTDDQIREIRSVYAGGGVSCADLARRYDIPYMTMSHIIRRERYKDVA